jgi:hypothetical protein
LDDVLPTLPKTSSSFIQEQDVVITSAPAACLVSLHISQAPIVPSDQVSSTPLRCRHIRNLIFSHQNSYSMSSSSLFSHHCLCRQFVFSAILSVLLSFVWFILTSAQFIFRLDGHDIAFDLHPVRQLWHVMVP